MILGRICGSVVSTLHHHAVDGRKQLIVERLDADGGPSGGYLIALDTAGAGVGETVLVLDEGNGARQILARGELPIRAVIVGIVDEVTLSPGS